MNTPLDPNLRKCFISNKNMDHADLGICLKKEIIKYKLPTSRLPELELLDDSYVSRIEFNNGIKSVELGERNYIVRTPDNHNATNWFPLVLRLKEHWVRSMGPSGTKKIKKIKMRKQLSITINNYYLLLDYSGSMAGPFIRQCIQSIKKLITETVQDQDMISLSVFNHDHILKFPLLNKKDNEQRITEEIEKSNQPNGMTSFYRALSKIFMDADFSRPVVIVSLTDGEDNDIQQQHYYDELLKQIQSCNYLNKNIKLMIITVGKLQNEDKIKRLTDTIKQGFLIKADQNVESIKTAYNTVQKLIISASGNKDIDIVGTQDLLMSAISLIVTGENGNFNQDDIWRVSARILNLCIVSFSKGKRPVNTSTLRNYCDIHRTLIEMMRDYPQIKTNLLASIRLFMDSTTPNNRRREIIPDIGEAIQLLSLVDDISWEQFSNVYIQESFRRSARYMSYLNVEKHDYSVEKQLKHYWDQSRTSMLLMCFNVLFLRDIVHRDGRTIEQLAQHYDNNLAYIPEECMVEFSNKFNYVRDMDCFEKVMNYVGLSDKPEDILELIFYGRTYESEPTPLSGGNLVVPSNNIRNIEIKKSNPSEDYVDYKNYQQVNVVPKRGTKITHLGWTVMLNKMNPQDAVRLALLFPGKKLKEEFYTAVMFSEKQELMKQKAKEIEGVQKSGIIDHYYENVNGVVVNITVDAVKYFMVVAEYNNMRSHKMKSHAKRGMMGVGTKIEPSIVVDCFGSINYN